MKFRVHVMAICGAALLPLAGIAAETTAQTPAEKQEKSAEAAKPAKKVCSKTTGSRIKSSRDCTPSASAARSYSAEQLQNTGKIETAEALRNLDPSVR